MSTNDTVVAVKYLGRTSLALVIGIVICFLASLGYNTYVKYSSKKIEVQAMNSNSTNVNTVD